MAYKKKSSKHHAKAVIRLASLKSINEKMDLGNGLSADVYEAAITDLGSKIDDYNTHLSQIDGKKNQIAESEKTLKDLSERMLAGVASKYGKDSDEYEKGGGVRKSERKRPPKKKNAA